MKNTEMIRIENIMDYKNILEEICPLSKNEYTIRESASILNSNPTQIRSYINRYKDLFEKNMRKTVNNIILLNKDSIYILCLLLKDKTPIAAKVCNTIEHTINDEELFKVEPIETLLEEEECNTWIQESMKIDDKFILEPKEITNKAKLTSNQKYQLVKNYKKICDVYNIPSNVSDILIQDYLAYKSKYSDIDTVILEYIKERQEKENKFMLEVLNEHMQILIEEKYNDEKMSAFLDLGIYIKLETGINIAEYIESELYEEMFLKFIQDNKFKQIKNIISTLIVK